MPASTTIYRIGAYARGVPSNTAGSRFGYALTLSEAKIVAETFEPWANQVPWFSPEVIAIRVMDDSRYRYEVERALGGWCDHPRIRAALDAGHLVTAIEAAKALPMVAYPV